MVNSFEFCSIHFSKKFRSTIFNKQYAVYGSKNEKFHPHYFIKTNCLLIILGELPSALVLYFENQMSTEKLHAMSNNQTKSASLY